MNLQRNGQRRKLGVLKGKNRNTISMESSYFKNGNRRYCYTDLTYRLHGRKSEESITQQDHHKRRKRTFGLIRGDDDDDNDDNEILIILSRNSQHKCENCSHLKHSSYKHFSSLSLVHCFNSHMGFKSIQAKVLVK